MTCSTLLCVVLCCLLAAALLVVCAIIAWRARRRLLADVRRTRDAAEMITLADLSRRLPVGGNDDVAELSKRVNAMLDRLQASVEVQRQLLDDVRHELKTPITIVRGHLEMMDPQDSEDVITARSIGISELDRLSRLVEAIDLLAVVEGEHGSNAEIDIAALTVRLGELIMAIPDHPWRVDEISTGQIHGDADRLLQAWLQLADNAAKHTPPGSAIEVGSTRHGNVIQFWVRDHGPGIPPELRHRIFRRFDRGDSRRTVGGSGLGLSIVDAIVHAHGGYCGVTKTDGGGATVSMHIPIHGRPLTAAASHSQER